ncbi:MAG: nucleoside phosphorylase [Anaerolineaceae bacterium]|nr:nucleoside phosphorylase [Anaerolineaceae bacterium]
MTNDIGLDKASKTSGKPQYHIRAKPGDVGKYVLLPGDPDRVLRIAKYLDNAREIAFHREHRTWTGEYKGVTISATSTGMGCPSAAIAVEELANIGATHFIRVGSTAGLQKGMKIGDIVVSTGAMRLDGASGYYAHESFPSIPDFFLTKALMETAVQHQVQRKYDLFMGISASSDAFYAETPEFQKMLIKHNVINVEMESSVINVIAHMRGLKAAMLCAVSGNLATGDVVYEGINTGLVQGWEDAIQIALDSIVKYENEGFEKTSSKFSPEFDYDDRYFPKY